jgi:hypothetical protein
MGQKRSSGFRENLAIFFTISESDEKINKNFTSGAIFSFLNGQPSPKRLTT